MATAYVTFSRVGKRGEQSEQLSILQGDQARSETVTTSGASQQGTFVAKPFEVAVVFCATALYANCLTTAAQGTGIYVPPNIPTTIGLQVGSRIALIDAP